MINTEVRGPGNAGSIVKDWGPLVNKGNAGWTAPLHSQIGTEKMVGISEIF